MADIATTLLMALLISGSLASIKLGIVLDDTADVLALSRDVLKLMTNYLNFTDMASVDKLPDDRLNLQWRRLNMTNGIYASQTVCELMREKIQGLITALPCRSTRYVMSQTDVFHLPHIAISTEPCDNEPASLYSLRLKPESKILTQLLKDVLLKLNWATVGLVYDKTMHSSLRNSIVRFTTDMGMEITLIPITGVKEPAVDKLKTARTKNLLVWTTAATLTAVFHKAKLLQMTGSDHYWIVFVDDISLVEASELFRSLAISNMLLVRRTRSHESVCAQSIQSEICQENYSLFEASVADAVLYFHRVASSRPPLNMTASLPTVKCFTKVHQPFPWGSSLLLRLQQVSLSGLTNIKGFDNEGFPRVVEYALYGVKYDKANGSIESVGTWRNDLGLRLTDGVIFTNRFQSFGNSLILVAAKEERPFVERQIVNNETVYSGFVFEILDELASRLHFRYQVVEWQDSSYGVVDKNGVWTGMVGRVVRGEVSMGVGPFAITSLRESVVDFTTPFWEDSFAILTLKSQSDTGKLFQMMRPFTTDVWISIAGALVVVALVSFMSSYYSPYTEWRRESTHISKKEASLKENFWIIYSSVIEQGPQFHPSGISSRCILGFWWLFTILIVSTYTANLAAFLTVVDDSSSINNLDELVGTQDVGILVQDGGNAMNVFSRSNNPLYQRVWNKIQQSPSVAGIEEALAYVKTGKYAFIGMRSILTHFASESCGEFTVSKESFNSGTFGFVLPENAPYKELTSFNIMKMLEGGLVDNWQHRWWPKVYNCSGEQNGRTGSATSLQLDSLGGLFIVYCVVTAAGFVSLLLEIAIRRGCPQKPTKG